TRVGGWRRSTTLRPATVPPRSWAPNRARSWTRSSTPIRTRRGRSWRGAIGPADSVWNGSRGREGSNAPDVGTRRASHAAQRSKRLGRLSHPDFSLERIVLTGHTSVAAPPTFREIV